LSEYWQENLSRDSGPNPTTRVESDYRVDYPTGTTEDVFWLMLKSESQCVEPGLFAESREFAPASKFRR
jgi:hypothetical protein